MNKFLRSLCVIGALSIFTLASTASADTVFSNFGPFDAFGNGGLIIQGPDVNTIGDVNQAAAFTVGSIGYLLTGIDLGIATAGPTAGTGPIDVLLTTDAAGEPGATLRSFSLNVNNPGKQILSASDDGSFTLNPNTTYWVVADGEGTFDGGWSYNSIGEKGPWAGQSEGLPWNLHDPEDDRFAFRVEGRPIVPEPTSACLLAIALLAAAGRVRRCR